MYTGSIENYQNDKMIPVLTGECKFFFLFFCFCFLTVVQICSKPEQDLECFGSAPLLLWDDLCLWGWGAGSKTRDLEGATVVTGSPEYMGSSGIHICAPPKCAGSIPHQDKTGQVPHCY